MGIKSYKVGDNTRLHFTRVVVLESAKYWYDRDSGVNQEKLRKVKLLPGYMAQPIIKSSK